MSQEQKTAKSSKNKKRASMATKERELDEALTSSSAFSNSSSKSPEDTLDELMQEAEQLFIQSDCEQSAAVLAKILQIAPKHTPAMDLLAQVYMDVGAEKQALQLAPKENPSKYMYLGQLLTGKDALKNFTRGIELMRKASEQLDMSNADDAAEAAALRRQIASGLCSIAEIYQTDLCEEEEAEQECENVLSQAVKVAPSSAESWGALANFRMIQGFDDQALSALDKCFQLLDEEAEQGEPETPYDFRCSVSKMLFELGQYDRAIDLLEDLLLEDDRVIEVHHLYSVSLFHTKRYKRAKEHAEEVVKMLTKMDANEYDPGLKKVVTELIRNCDEAIKSDPAAVQREEEEDAELDDERLEDDDEAKMGDEGEN